MDGEGNIIPQTKDEGTTSDTSAQPYVNQTTNKSLLIYISALVVLLIILGGLFYWGTSIQNNQTQQITDIANSQESQSQQKHSSNAIGNKKEWKNFTDNNKRISLHYPSTWHVINTPYATAGELSKYQIAHIMEDASDPFSEGIVVALYPNLGTMSLREFLQTIWYTPEEFTPDVANAFINNIQIHPPTQEIPFELCEDLYLRNGVAGYALWTTSKNDGIFIIARNMSYSSFEYQDDLFREIISSITYH